MTPDGLEAVEAEKEVTFTFTATQEGQPVDDLQPYLGAGANVTIVSKERRAIRPHLRGGDRRRSRG